MSTTTLIILVASVILIILIGAYFSINNREVSLRKEAEAQKEKLESIYDRMWKIIQQKAEIADKYRETFENIYPELISGRYKDNNSNVMKWIQESNPNFDITLFKELGFSIESQRTQFDLAQQRLIDIIRERETLLNSIPQKFFVSNKSKIDYVLISSTRTKTIRQTGLDDDVKLFS